MRPAEIILLLALGLPAVQAGATDIVGEARAVDGGALRYTEYHRCSPSGDRCEVEYRDRSDVLFARKTLDYSLSYRSPTLVMEDLRQGETLRVARDPAEALVVDAGFDHYVRERWDALAAGRQVKFAFLVAGRDSALDMRAQMETSEACPERRLCLRIEVDNWLISALVEPIRLQYDRSNRRLLQFKGVSNIRDPGGHSQQVRIDYNYSLAATAERS